MMSTKTKSDVYYHFPFIDLSIYHNIPKKGEFFFHNPFSTKTHFPFCLLFGDFTQLQKLMWGIKIVKTVPSNLVISIHPF
ncbi:hypothetical protein E2C01_062130 [Portunus trituberculatus]|uniref:Uncharacterized protein n=1 Tax=Portunus trituberculatus TaxID=210409 RepID=A0A5B7HCT0_PORTR|nr:hypothetical protein [Portunus trituberculatus]